MELRDLRVFMAVVKTGSFTRAGEELSLVQSAVSKAMARLEHEFSLPLLERRRDGVRLTSHGRVLRTYAAHLLDAADRTEGAMALRRNQARTRVSIGLLPTITPLVLDRLLQQLHVRLPDVRVDVREASPALLDEAFARGDIDVLVAWRENRRPRDEGAETVKLELGAAVLPDHPLANNAMAPAARDLAVEDWVTFPPGGPGRRWLEQLAGDIGFEPRIAGEVETLMEMKAFVLAGVGTALLPAGVVATEIETGALALVRLADPVPAAELEWTADRLRNDPVMDEVRAVLREVIGSLGRESADDLP